MKKKLQPKFIQATVALVLQFLFKPVAKCALFLVFLILSCVLQILVLLIPFRITSQLLGQRLAAGNSLVEATEKKEKQALAIGRICERATRRLPLKSKCLVQAILTNSILSLINIPCVINIGVSRSRFDAVGMKAHAWTMTSNQTITGGKICKSYTTIIQFAHGKFIRET